MEEIEQNLTAVTSEFGDERPQYGLGVSIRCNGIEVDYLRADGLEEHAPLDWTPDMAMVLLGENGYDVTGNWTDISGICVEDPIWEAPVAKTTER